jgi:hypothetical protein
MSSDKEGIFMSDERGKKPRKGFMYWILSRNWIGRDEEKGSPGSEEQLNRKCLLAGNREVWGVGLIADEAERLRTKLRKIFSLDFNILDCKE